MDSENAKLAGALFHTLKAVGKQRDPIEAEKWRKVIIRRNRRDEASRRFYDKLARWDFERGMEG